MKILVIELARFGDIFQTWPALRALRRAHPQAQIDILTRERYSAALDGLEVINNIHVLQTKDLLEPLLSTQRDVKKSYELASGFLDPIKEAQYDWVVNFSFSPLSSFITHYVSAPQARVSGYTRHADGFLSIPDDMSAYFYAQVGLDKKNRYHLADIFASMLDMDLVPEDWCGPNYLNAKTFQEDQIVIHIGASEAQKRLPAEAWARVLESYVANHPKDKIVLVGTKEEADIGQQILSHMNDAQIVNMIGKTTLRELFAVINNSRLLVGADSAPIHMASLLHTPCLNISVGKVNFWETGPRTLGSVVLRYQQESHIVPSEIADAISRLRNKTKLDLRWIQVTGERPSYYMLEPRGADFDWRLIKAIYQGEDFPVPENKTDFLEGIKNLFDMNAIMLDQLQALREGKPAENISPVLDSGEEVIDTIGKLVPSLSIIVRWYQTEKLRMGPADREVILQKTVAIHELLQKVCGLYVSPQERQQIIEERP